MENKKVLQVVAIECPPETEEKFVNWCCKIHLPMLFKSKWVDRVTLYKIAPVNLLEEHPRAKFLNIYEFKDRKSFEAWYSGPERAEARKEMEQTWPVKGYDIKLLTVYEPIKSWQKE
jgi:hypothetical protein